MGEDGSKGIRSDRVTLCASSRHDQQHQFSFETSLQQVFDVYIPDALYQHAATERFVAQLCALSEGATVYQGVEGSWRQEIEDVRVLRFSVTTVDGKGTRIWEIDDVRDAVRQVVMDFMVDLRESEAHTEEAVFFNDWTSRGTLVRRS